MGQFWSSSRSLRHIPFCVKYDCENHGEPVFAQKRLCCAKERGSPSDGAAVHARPSLSQPESRRAEQPLLSDACDLVAPPTRANGLARMSV